MTQHPMARGTFLGLVGALLLLCALLPVSVGGLVGGLDLAQVSSDLAALCRDNGWHYARAVVAPGASKHLMANLTKEFSARGLQLGAEEGSLSRRTEMTLFIVEDLVEALDRALALKPKTGLVYWLRAVSDASEVASAAEKVVLDRRANALVYLAYRAAGGGGAEELEVRQIISTPRFTKLVMNEVRFKAGYR